MTSLIRNAWKLTKPYWYGNKSVAQVNLVSIGRFKLSFRMREQWLGLLLLGVIVGFSFFLVYLNVQFNHWNKTFYDALQNYDKDGFVSSILRFCWLAAFFIAVAVYNYFLQMMMKVKWRAWLTESYLDFWLQKQVYYRLQLEGNPADNPDQRISDDIRLFIEFTLDLFLGVLSNVVSFFSFLTILWGLSGDMDIPIAGSIITVHRYMVWVAVIYAVGGTMFMRWIGRPLIGLNYIQQRYEADFRFSMVRLRENSESVAFYKGENPEKKAFVSKFDELVANFWRIMYRQRKMLFFKNFYNQVAIIFPYVVCAPRYFAKILTFGDLSQTADAFDQVRSSLSYLVDVYVDQVAMWCTVVQRLSDFSNAIEDLRARAETTSFRPTPSTGADVIVSELDLWRPKGGVIQSGLSFTIKAGSALLIQGPSGCGKSTLLRAVAGIWPYAKGDIKIPANANILFVPQRPYMPLGSLRDALVYPNHSASDAEVKELLVTCQLGQFADRLDEVAAWGLIMSLGEQQRVAFFRALLMKHEVLFLDEATSALDEKSESYFYQLLRERLPEATIVSVGHRSTLKQWHKDVMELKAAA